jgi:hypothetical protein
MEMMTLWRLINPAANQFATASLRGTWTVDSGRTTCPECGSSSSVRIQPLMIEWEVGSDRIGDFTWPAYSSVVTAKVSVIESLSERFSGFEPGPVEMLQAPRLRRPKRITTRTKSRVWLPYEGSPLAELHVTVWANVDEAKSTVQLVRVCTTCGRYRYEVTGVEIREHRWDQESQELVDFHVPRVPDAGLFVRNSDLERAHIFRLHQFPAWLLCVDEVKNFVEAEGFTNIGFLEYGNVL